MSDMDGLEGNHPTPSPVDRADQGFLTEFPHIRVRPALSKVSALTRSDWRTHLLDTAKQLYDGPTISGGHGLLSEYVHCGLADLSNELRFPRQGVPEFTPAGLALLTTLAEKLETLGVTPEHLQAANRASTTAIKQLHLDREDQLIMASEWAFHLLQNPAHA